MAAERHARRLAKKQQGAYAEAQAVFEVLCQAEPTNAEAASQVGEMSHSKAAHTLRADLHCIHCKTAIFTMWRSCMITAVM